MLKIRGRRSIHRNEDGVAFIEFALIFPVILLLAMGGLEVTNLALVHVRLNHAAETAADNAARVRIQIDENDIEEIFAGVDMVGKIIDFKTKGRVILSSIQDNGLTGASKGQTIRWQRCFGDGTTAPRYGAENAGKTNGSLSTGVGATGQKIAAQLGTAVMYAEVTYRYEPMIFAGFIDPRDIRYETAFNVRERTELGITNVRNLTVRRC